MPFTKRRIHLDYLAILFSPDNYMHFKVLETDQSFSSAQIEAIKAHIANPINSMQSKGVSGEFGGQPVTYMDF